MSSAIMPTYARAPIAFERGEGVYLFTTDGRRVLDFGAGVAVTSLGHAHPHLVKAVQEQAAKLWHVSNLYTIPEQERLAERLTERTFADAAFFCNSGAEAMECCLKVARKYQHDNGHPDRYRMIGFDGAFHGRTLATIAAGGNAKHLKGFEPAMEGFDHVPFGNLNEVRNAITPETAAIIVEPVQGEGGIHPASEDFLKGLRETADEFGLVLIFDEVQCGMGRTGRLFAHEWAGVSPDVMAIAKGLGGGFPVGACLARKELAESMGPGTHGSTFGGNPMAMTAANAVLDVMLEEGFFDRVNTVAGHLKSSLEALAEKYSGVFSEARGSGLMMGLKCVSPNVEVVGALAEKGLLTIVAGDNVIRLIPPLIVENKHVAEAVAILSDYAAKAGQPS